jgi:hypothetical protein
VLSRVNGMKRILAGNMILSLVVTEYHDNGPPGELHQQIGARLRYYHMRNTVGAPVSRP